MVATAALLGCIGWGCGESQTGDGADASVVADVARVPVDASGASLDVEITPEPEDVMGTPGDGGPPPDGAGEPSDASVGQPDSVVEPPEEVCLYDEDCAPIMLGLGPCMVARCVDEECVSEPLVDGAACDDQDPCTETALCVDGSCAGHTHRMAAAHRRERCGSSGARAIRGGAARCARR
ncbi:MAG: hypothetical protein QF464_13415 [Myxococcota bacterium]|nr:hypothetical protein [Myxococcota bacterium]